MDISFFETHDYVKKNYKRAHGREPNAAKVKQVNSSFIQGKHLFNNASVADISVKPLLLYYSVLSYSRGVILLNDVSKKEESLKPRHGLKELNWSATLSGGISNVLDIEITASGDGTFQELVNCCENKQEEEMFFNNTDRICRSSRDLGRIKFSQDGSKISLGDLLARFSDTAMVYGNTTDRQKHTALSRVALREGELHMAFPFSGIPAEMDSYRGMPKVRVGSSILTAPGLGRGVNAADTLIFEASARDSSPAFKYMKGETMRVFKDFDNGDKMNEFFKMYLISYAMGMLVRYFPSAWMGIISGGVGDFGRPVLMEAVEAVSSKMHEYLKLALYKY